MSLISNDPAMTYENVVRAAFGYCGKYGDPFALAAQDVYNHNISEGGIGFRLKLGLSAALYKAGRDAGEDDGTRLQQLSEEVWSVDNDHRLNELMTEAANIIDG